jgi:hypothetical protein
MGFRIGQRRTFQIAGVIVLLVGLGSAVLVYRTAGSSSEAVLGYEEGGGTVYSIRPEDSKKYLRDMEGFGGKANVLLDELRNWFVGLWSGESLAFAIACITILAAFGAFYAAGRMPGRAGPDDHGS